jgi:hypothetical protein
VENEWIFCLLPFINTFIDKKASHVQRKKKKMEKPTLLCWSKRERETHFVTLYSSNTKSGTHFFHSFSTNAEETKKEKDPFFPLHLSKIEIERNPTFSP